MIDEDAIRETLAAYVAAWHRNDMDSWGALFTKDSDFITNTAVWWKSRDENVAGHKAIPTWTMAEMPKYRSQVAESFCSRPTSHWSTRNGNGPASPILLLAGRSIAPVTSPW